MSKRVLTDVYSFNDAMIPPVIASLLAGPWASKTTAAAGTPTVKAAGGAMVLTLEATAEVQNICLYMGDVLPYDIDELIQVDIWAALSASLDSHISAAWGLASARNDAIASITNRCLFRAVGNNNLLCETADGTHSASSIATGLTVGTTFVKTTMEFKTGINTVSEGLSTGGKSRILMSAENSQGLARRVAPSQQFDMSAYSAGLQLFAQLQKTSNAAVGSLSIQRMEVQYRRN